MSRGKLKFDWSVYSARRNVTVKLLFDKGIVKDYDSYVAYCDEMSVVPMTQTAFTAEASLLETPKTLTFHRNLSPTEGPASEEHGLVATVWFAGVKDEAPRSDSVEEVPVAPPPKQSKKKQKE